MSQKISRADFDKMTKKYKDKNPKKTHAVMMDRASFERILANPNTVQVAVYFAEDDDGNDTIAALGVDSTGTLLNDPIENRGGLCPPNCPTP